MDTAGCAARLALPLPFCIDPGQVAKIGAPPAAPTNASVTTGAMFANVYDVTLHANVTVVPSGSYADDASSSAWNDGAARGAQSNDVLISDDGSVTFRSGMMGALWRRTVTRAVSDAPVASVATTATV